MGSAFAKIPQPKHPIDFTMFRGTQHLAIAALPAGNMDRGGYKKADPSPTLGKMTIGFSRSKALVQLDRAMKQHFEELSMGI